MGRARLRQGRFGFVTLSIDQDLLELFRRAGSHAPAFFAQILIAGIGGAQNNPPVPMHIDREQ
jgi:hypothetical protein